MKLATRLIEQDRTGCSLSAPGRRKTAGPSSRPHHRCLCCRPLAAISPPVWSRTTRQSCQRGRLLHGRLRSGNRAHENADHHRRAIQSREPSGNSLPRGAAPATIVLQMKQADRRDRLGVFDKTIEGTRHRHQEPCVLGPNILVCSPLFVRATGISRHLGSKKDRPSCSTAAFILRREDMAEEMPHNGLRTSSIDHAAPAREVRHASCPRAAPSSSCSGA